MTRFKTFMVGLVAIGAFFLGGWLLRKGFSPVAPPPAAAPSIGGTRLFNSVLQTVRTYAVDSLDESGVYRLAASGVLGELGDPYAVLMADRDTAAARERIGPAPVQGLYLDLADGFVAVVSVVPGSPAAAAGIRAGDAVLRVGEVNIRTQTAEEVVALVDGRAGTTVGLRLGREGANAALRVELTRGTVPPLPEPTVATLDDGTTHLRAYRIDQAAIAVLEQALRDGGAGRPGLVIDLRGAVEGTLADAVTFATRLLDRGQSVVIVRRRPADDSTAVAGEAETRHVDSPVVVLVDRGTAGAAEVVAGALQDHDRAAIVGETTFGRAGRSSFFPLGDGMSLRLTTELWVTPSGRVIQRTLPLQQSEASIDTVEVRPEFRTEGGRVILGGGGVVPDREVATVGEVSEATDHAMNAARQLLARAPDRKSLIAALTTN
ncbi:MAG: S41 family peptidase [Gemmatimonadales bacterium]